LRQEEEPTSDQQPRLSSLGAAADTVRVVRLRRRDPAGWVRAADAAVAAQMQRLRSMTYDELLGQLDVTTPFTVPTQTGEVLDGEVEVFWDNPKSPGGDLRVVARVFHPTRSVLPTISSDDFIRAVDGSFVGE
jgi:hypothetical protein